MARTTLAVHRFALGSQAKTLFGTFVGLHFVAHGSDSLSLKRKSSGFEGSLVLQGIGEDSGGKGVLKGLTVASTPNAGDNSGQPVPITSAAGRSRDKTGYFLRQVVVLDPVCLPVETSASQWGCPSHAILCTRFFS